MSIFDRFKKKKPEESSAKPANSKPESDDDDEGLGGLSHSHKKPIPKWFSDAFGKDTTHKPDNQHSHNPNEKDWLLRLLDNPLAPSHQDREPPDHDLSIDR